MNKDIPFIMTCVGIVGVIWYLHLFFIAVVFYICLLAAGSFFNNSNKVDYRAENNRRAEERHRRQEIKFRKWLEDQED